MEAVSFWTKIYVLVIIIVTSNRCLPSLFARLCCIIDLSTVIKAAWSFKKGAVQHVHGVFCRCQWAVMPLDRLSSRLTRFDVVSCLSSLAIHCILYIYIYIYRYRYRYIYIYIDMFISYSHGILLYYNKHYYEYTH